MALDKVLLLLDEEIPRRNLEEQLKARYDLTSVATPAAAQAKLSKGNFDLLIADAELLAEKESDLLGEIQSAAARPLVVVISAFGRAESADDCLNKGAFACLLNSSA